MRARFHAAESQLGGEGGGEGEGGEGGPPAALSLLGMAGRLSRMEAAKLFYQVLGEAGLVWGWVGDAGLCDALRGLGVAGGTSEQ